MVWRYERKCTDKRLTLRKSMNMRASDLGKFSHFHIKKLLFLSNFVGTLNTLSVEMT